MAPQVPRLAAPALALAMALSCGPARACDPPAPNATVDFSATKLDRATTLAGLAVLGRAAVGSDAKGVLTGLYVPHVSLGVGYRISMEIDRESGATLACFTGVDLTLHTDSVVHMAAEIPRGGCAESAVYGHEMRHHQIQAEQTRLAAARFLALNPLPTLPFRAAGKQQAMALAEAYAKAYLDQLGKSVENFVVPKQREFDSPREYARISQLCAAELSAMLAPGRGR